MKGRQTSIHVDAAQVGYDILIGSGGLDDPASFLRANSAASVAVVVTNDTLAPMYGRRVARSLTSAGWRVETVSLPDGEAYKVWSSVQLILDAMVALRCDRDSMVVALGGGVVGDIAGFAAACFMRGVRHTQVPTSLLAQVDSSVGGKTGINHPQGKNLIGAIHPPCRVVIDLEVLSTLPEREFAAGLAEIIKYGAACDPGFLDWIEANLEGLRKRSTPVLLEAVRRACEIKARIVAVDERELGLRAILNFGHTFAHAIETGLGHGQWLHGEAVGCGMLLAADLSSRMGRIDADLVRRLETIVHAAGLPVHSPPLGIPRYLDLMGMDKKRQGGQIRFVLLDGPGRSSVAAVDLSWVVASLEARVVAGRGATDL